MNKVINIDSLEFDIKRALVMSPNAELQWHKIRNELLKKYTNYTEDTFTTTLQRKLKKLIISGDIEKKSSGHQEVYYFIEKKRLSKIKEQLDRELAHTLFDDAWNSFTPAQRKRELQYLLNQRGEVITILQKSSLDLLSYAKEEAESLISRLENPTEEMKQKYSSQDRENILKQVKNQVKQMEKITTNLTGDKENRITEQKVRAEMIFINEFMEKVVELNYGGNFRGALRDLMKRALEEEKKQDD